MAVTRDGESVACSENVGGAAAKRDPNTALLKVYSHGVFLRVYS